MTKSTMNVDAINAKTELLYLVARKAFDKECERVQSRIRQTVDVMLGPSGTIPSRLQAPTIKRSVTVRERRGGTGCRKDTWPSEVTSHNPPRVESAFMCKRTHSWPQQCAMESTVKFPNAAASFQIARRATKGLETDERKVLHRGNLLPARRCRKAPRPEPGSGLATIVSKEAFPKSAVIRVGREVLIAAEAVENFVFRPVGNPNFQKSARRKSNGGTGLQSNPRQSVQEFPQTAIAIRNQAVILASVQASGWVYVRTYDDWTRHDKWCRAVSLLLV